MKIVELKIDDSSISGFDATAFVENPAIEQDFVAFNKVVALFNAVVASFASCIFLFKSAR